MWGYFKTETYRSHPKAVLALSFRWFVSCTNTGPTLPDTSLFQKKQDTTIIVSDVPGFKCWQFIQVLIKYCVGKYCVSQTKHICSWWNIVYYLCFRSPHYFYASIFSFFGISRPGWRNTFFVKPFLNPCKRCVSLLCIFITLYLDFCHIIYTIFLNLIFLLSCKLP